jgi:hypothetical protein
MSELSKSEIDYRANLARELLSLRRTPMDDVNYVDFESPTPMMRTAALKKKLGIPFPDNLGPVPQKPDTKPALEDPLPKVDIVVVTWTVDENDGLADVLTPGFGRDAWYRYAHLYEQNYATQIRRGAPAYNAKRLDSYFITKIGDKKVLCFKSELHLNQDGIRNINGTGQTSLPVRQLFKQIIQETECTHIITTGTCGGIKLEYDLGDVLIKRGAKFRCQSEFENAPYNHKLYKSDWEVPTTHFADAEKLMAGFTKKLLDPVFGPPTKRHEGSNWTLTKAWKPNIIHEKGTGQKKLPAFHPILTTDYFEFGNSKNVAELWAEGCGVEMGDAVLGLVCMEDLTHPPKWLVVRNLSDPQINGDMPDVSGPLDMRIHWAVWYYDSYGYWTSVMSALATWSVIAGL